jgi:hypothetical protein
MDTYDSTCSLIYRQVKYNSNVLQCRSHLPKMKVECIRLLSPSLNEHRGQIMIHLYVLQICDVIKARLDDVWNHRIWKQHQFTKFTINLTQIMHNKRKKFDVLT